MKSLGILGSTGSIGTQTLEIVRSYPDRLRVVALAAGTNTERMEKQIREFHPSLVVMWSEQAAADLKARVADVDVRIEAGMAGLLEMAVLPEMDTFVTAVVGMIGIRPTIAAIEHHKEIALANKETLVTAGHLIMPLAAKEHVRILPVDSEHSAIFQSLNGENRSQISRILLTASGGPFRGRKREELEKMTVEDALKHPNWSMGRKITIDSATLVNKGLEVMEVKWLFGVDLDRIEVVVHPQSILHSAVEFQDGAVIGQMGIPDMKLPIQYALFYPDRLPISGFDANGVQTENPKLDLFAVGSMTFEKPDPETFTGLKLAFEAARCGGTMPTVFNAANEEAVALFLDHKIRFLQIADLIGEAMAQHQVVQSPSVDEILEAEAQAHASVLRGI